MVLTCLNCCTTSSSLSPEFVIILKRTPLCIKDIFHLIPASANLSHDFCVYDELVCS